MPKTIQGLVLVDTWASALNNAGTDVSERTDNIVRTKVFWTNDGPRPYVSGQAWRYWWRDTLARRKGWELSPINREKKIAYTAADPIKYPDDDIFGYMRAPKKTGKTGSALTRQSVLKTSVLVSVVPHRPTADFGTFSRLEGDPVPYEHEFYSTVLKGIFSIDLESAGVFKAVQTAGSQNLPSDYEVPSEYAKVCTKRSDGYFELVKEIRVKRVRDVIEVLPFLEGGAMQARHLTRVAPSLVILGAFRTGSHLLSHAVTTRDGAPEINIASLRQVLQDYGDEVLSPLFIGREAGFLDSQAEPLEKLQAEFGEKVVLGSVVSVVKALSERIPDLID